MKTYTFHVSGTHCAACKILIEDILSEQNFSTKSEVNLKKETVTIEVDSDQSPKAIAEQLTDKIRKNGYMLSMEKQIV